MKHEELHIPSGDAVLSADLMIPDQAEGVVVFIHGSGSSRFGPRNRFLAAAVRDQHFATLLIDLLTPEEEAIDFRTARFRFDTDMLARRVIDVTHWLRKHESTKALRIAYLGCSTGAAAALMAAAHHPDEIAAIVCRSGRPDLAIEALPRVTAPTMFVVGSKDTAVLRMNREAFPHLHCEKRLEIIEGATHLFDEPGALQQTAERTGEWLQHHVAALSV